MTTMTPKEHIENIRKTKFSIGGEPNLLTEDLHQAVKNLSGELYAKDVHFLMEIIQNAEDNAYSEGVKPSLEFIVTSRDITGTGASSTLLVFNNEIGFSAKNIESICSVGRSTKKGQRQNGYIGEKGIGFKSVFLITAQPYIFSNGYQIRFSEDPCPHCNLGYIVPEWVDENPTIAAIQKIYGGALPATTIILPLKHDKENDVKLQLSSIHPELLLFLSKIRQLSVREDNEGPKLNTVSAISISSEIDFVTRKNVAAESYTLHLSAEEDREDGDRECSYYMWRHKFPVNKANRVDRRMEINHLVITLAFPNGKRLNRGKNSPGIYAFLPTETVTNFPFIIQADFVLASSRENILWDNKWNLGILDCVPDAFVNAFISLLKTSETAPASCLPRMFEFLPVESSSHPKLNNVRDAIKKQLLNETIMPSESQTAQKFFYKPCDVGRIMPAFWDILVKARSDGVSLHNLSSHGKYALNSAFDKEHYDQILNFLEVKSMENEWYTKCIQCSDLVLGLSEKVYLELLFFVADKWRSHFQHTNMGNIPLLKYVGRDSNLQLCSLVEAIKWGGKKLYMSYDARHISWLIDWNKEFCCAAGFFIPKSTQECLRSFHSTTTVTAWLSETVGASYTTVNDYAVRIIDLLNNDKRLVLAFAHFLCQSLLKTYVSRQEVESLCKKMPLLDNYGNVRTRNCGILVPANGSKWVKLIGSNPWRGTNYIELGEEYLRSGYHAGVYTSVKEFTDFLKLQIGASDIPQICAPDVTFAAVSSQLTKDNAFLLLEWIQNLRRRGNLEDGRFKSCIKEGSWLRTRVGSSVSCRPPCQSFFLTSSSGDLLNSGSELVDIPLIDQQFYGTRITEYKEDLMALGVKFEFGEACKFIGDHLMSLASNGNLTKDNVFSLLNFIRFLRNKYLPVDKFIESVKNRSWLRTSHGVRAPVESILYDSEWLSAAKISNLPFIDQEYYGKEIMNFREELKLLGAVVGFDEDYQRLVDFFKVLSSFTALSINDVLLIFRCIRHSRSSDRVVSILKDKKWLKTTIGYRSPTECFLFNSEWGCLLQVFGDFPVINEKSYGDSVYCYRNELKKLGVVVDFQDATKAFTSRFKQLASAHSITKEHVLLFLRCYRDLKKTPHPLPADVHNCIYGEEWLKTRIGLKCPKDAILFSSDWEHISPIALLPFIDESEKGYGSAIREYEKELQEIGVNVKFDKGSKFVASGLRIPPNPTDVTPSSALSLLECIRNILKEKGGLPEEFLSSISKKWVKTYMGYRAPNECLLFAAEWSLSLEREDAAFIDEKFYGSDLSSYQKELKAIGVTVDVGSGCQLLASQLESHSNFDAISRIYMYLDKSDWKPEDGEAKRIWIPNGSDNGEWVLPEECVVYDKDGLFSLRLNVLEKHYDRKLLAFFSMSLNVRHNPSVDDYCRLWKSWEESGHELSPAECCAFWVFMGKHWSSKTTKDLLSQMMKLPVNRDAEVVQLVNKQDVFIPDDLLLVDLFERSSPDPIFVWYPQRSLASIPRTKLNDIYRSTGVRSISASVEKNQSSESDGGFKQVDPKEGLIWRELITLVLGFLSDPCVDMDVEKRQAVVKSLLDSNVSETDEPVLVTYSLSMSSGKAVNVKAKQMIRWERESSKLFFQKVERSSGHMASIEFATSFGKVIAEGLLWEKEDRIAELSELIKLGWLLEFEKEAIGFLMKSKNLQLYMEDAEFLKAAFSSE